MIESSSLLSYRVKLPTCLAVAACEAIFTHPLAISPTLLVSGASGRPLTVEQDWLRQQLQDNVKFLLRHRSLKDGGTQYSARLRAVTIFLSRLLNIPPEQLWPLTPNHALLFLSHQQLLGNAYSTVVGYFAAINWGREIMGVPSLSALPEGQQVRRFLDSTQRANQRPIEGKLPIDALLGEQLIDYNLSHSRHAGDHYDRTANIISLALAGLNRVGEVSNLYDNDLMFERQLRYVDRFFNYESSKSMSLHDSARTPRQPFRIYATNTRNCPVRRIAKWCQDTGLQNPSVAPRPVFPGANLLTPVSYSTVRVHLLASLDALGLDSRLYGTHSLRRGPATDAYLAGVPVPEIRKRLRHAPGSSATFQYLPADASRHRTRRTQADSASLRQDVDGARQ